VFLLAAAGDDQGERSDQDQPCGTGKSHGVPRDSMEEQGMAAGFEDRM
jgi:hypothetical protein